MLILCPSNMVFTYSTTTCTCLNLVSYVKAKTITWMSSCRTAGYYVKYTMEHFVTHSGINLVTLRFNHDDQEDTDVRNIVQITL